jgi:hypothetical protein
MYGSAKRLAEAKVNLDYLCLGNWHTHLRDLSGWLMSTCQSIRVMSATIWR